MPTNWDDFRFFLALARERRLAGAARALRVDHTTIARRLESLEAALGARLFYRTAAGYLITPEGKRILAEAEAIEHRVISVVAKVRQDAHAVSGQVRIAVPESFSTFWLAPQLPRLKARHPSLEVEILAGTSQSDLSRGEADLAVRTPRPKRRELTAVRLAESTVGLYASREVMRRGKWDLDADPPKAEGIPLLLYSHQLDFLQTSSWLRAIIEQADVRMTSNSTLTLIAAARAHMGVAVLARFIGRGAGLLPAGRRDVSKHDLWLVSHPEFRRDPRVVAAANFIKSIAAGLRDPA